MGAVGHLFEFVGEQASEVTDGVGSDSQHRPDGGDTYERDIDEHPHERRHGADDGHRATEEEVKRERRHALGPEYTEDEGEREADDRSGEPDDDGRDCTADDAQPLVAVEHGVEERCGVEEALEEGGEPV
ncbi:hypothetical protein BM92_07215 [Haloferax mediterranei ATCC 33500]|uniref:Uncharacterized protein n=1 Tax=Haloferax mediterranei (strain ATCC 33500 / DSM 1411 / JCM 8866 / NBRC 14739 / NCIMB 2177 / R-4) TaxID=523841 RepID=A0A059TVA6_HALMT|nr:hypothetical protein BM92_07215 [Haloferax mediterranei ATCC 33500]